MTAQLSECSYAVVDCETTGLFPGAHHRVIELAIIQLDGLDGEQREWVTLLDPERDLGDAGIHGIRGRDIREAPRFQDAVGDVLELLAGRIVAHNARFDCGFLEAELTRAGYPIGTMPSICTVEMAHRLTLEGEVGACSPAAELPGFPWMAEPTRPRRTPAFARGI